MQNNTFFEGSETFYSNCITAMEDSTEENIEIALWVSQR